MRKRENARKQTRNHDTTAAYVRTHTPPHFHMYIRSGVRPTESDGPERAGFSGSATESEGATRDARRISEEREKLACGTEVARERERTDQRRGVLAWMTRHCRGARVPRNHTACTRVYTRTHAYAARAGTSEALSARYARVHWVTWKCVS